jgi:hypothetical protein
MAATGTLIPAQLDVRAIIGGDFAATLVLYSDVNQSVAFDLTGYTVSLIIGGGLLTLTSGSGLTITAATGTVAVVITDTQTLTLPGPAQHYVVKLVDGGGLISFPLSGNMFLALP